MLNLTIDQLRAIALAAYSCDESIPEFLFRNKGSESIYTIQEFEAFLTTIAERVTPEFNQMMQYFPERVREIDTDAKPPLPTETKQVRDLQVGDRFWWRASLELPWEPKVATVTSIEPFETGSWLFVVNHQHTANSGKPTNLGEYYDGSTELDVITHPAAPFATWDEYLTAMGDRPSAPQSHPHH